MFYHLPAEQQLLHFLQSILSLLISCILGSNSGGISKMCINTVQNILQQNMKYSALNWSFLSLKNLSVGNIVNGYPRNAIQEGTEKPTQLIENNQFLHFIAKGFMQFMLNWQQRNTATKSIIRVPNCNCIYNTSRLQYHAYSIISPPINMIKTHFPQISGFLVFVSVIKAHIASLLQA